jgi:hypothetical protein
MRIRKQKSIKSMSMRIEECEGVTVNPVNVIIKKNLQKA